MLLATTVELFDGLVARGIPGQGRLAEAFPGRGSRVTYLEGPRLGLSSTAIRARVAAGRSIRYLVPDMVEAYIADKQLYRRPTSQ